MPSPRNQPVLCLVHAGIDQEAINRWSRSIAEFWPVDERPETTVANFSHVVSRLEADDHARQRDESLFILLAQSKLSPIEIDRFISACSECGLPAIVVVESPSDWRPLQRLGVLFVDPGVSPATFGAMAYALAERQAAVNVLAGEVRLSQRCQAGIRMEMERMHDELNLAASIQREFTSAPIPTLDGLELGLLFRPMNFVSGDIYNVRALDEHRATFLLADVVGHGVPAALLTMVLANSLMSIERDAMHQRVFEPSTVLERLNDRLCETSAGSGRFATAVYGVIDSRARTISFAGAGHPSPLLIRGGVATEIETNGPLLGVFENAEFDQKTITLRDSDSFMVYSDGLDLAFPKSWTKELPSARIDRLLRELNWSEEAKIQSVIGDLEALLDGQMGSLHQSDDVTVLAVSALRSAIVAPQRMAA